MKLDSLEDLLIHELNDLYSADDQLVEALPKMAEAASSDELKQAFEHHLQETRDHRDRVQEIFGQLAKRRNGKECEAMKGLIEEGEEVIQTSGGDPAVKDAALSPPRSASSTTRSRHTARRGRSPRARPRRGDGPPRPDARRGEQRRQAPDQDRHRRPDEVRHQREGEVVTRV